MTGWPPGLLQDDDRKLSRWFASRLGARYQLRMNMTTQPEALRLANQLETEWPEDCDTDAIAAELRRLHEANQELLEALKEIEWSNDSKWQADRARAAIAKHGGRDA